MIKPSQGTVVFTDLYDNCIKQSEENYTGVGKVYVFNLVREENILLIKEDSIIIFDKSKVLYVIIDDTLYGFVPVSEIVAVVE